ncbi:MAG: glycosyltransferase [Myxococcales bacterium]|jgi:glycosyltransferase involved in cell wall biosynthesis
MNILLLHERAVPGGLETRLLTHARVLKSRGHRVLAVHAPGLMSQAFAESGIEVVPFDFGSREDFGGTVARLRQLIRTEAIDFCDAHPFMSLLPGALAALAEGVPYSLNFHGRHDWDSELLLFRHTLSLLWPHAALATANAPATRDFFVSAYGIDGSRFVCVPNALDLDGLRDAPEAGLPPRRLLVLSRLDSDKLLSLRAAARAIASYADLVPEGLEVRISGGGDGEQEARRVLQPLAEKGVRLDWRGPTARPQEEIAWADAVFGIGRAALEGLAARRPVVVCGALGNLAGLCQVAGIERWFESNLNGRNGPDAGAAVVAAELAAVKREDVYALGDWVLEHAGPAQLAAWAEAIEGTRGRSPAEGAGALGESLIAFFSDYYRVIAEKAKVVEAREHALAHAAATQAELSRVRAHDAAVATAALGLEQACHQLIAGARAAGMTWPPRPIEQARALWRVKKQLLPRLREAVAELHRALG